MRQYYKNHWKTVLNLINNSLICAGTNISNCTMILSFYRSKSHSISNPGFKILPRIINTTSTTAWEKGFNKVSYECYSKVLNAPTYYTTLAPNGALPDPKFCNQCKPWKLSLKLASKNSWIPEKDVLPQTHLIRYAPKTQDTWSFCPKW